MQIVFRLILKFTKDVRQHESESSVKELQESQVESVINNKLLVRPISHQRQEKNDGTTVS